MGLISPGRGLLRCSGDVVGLGLEAGLVVAAFVGNLAVCDPSPAKGLLWHGFLLRRNSDLAGISCGEERLPYLVLEPVQVLEPDLVLGVDPGLVLEPDSILDLAPRGGLFVQQRKDFDFVFLRCFQIRLLVRRGLIPTFIWKMV